MPTGVVENEFAAASGHWWNLLCHRVEEDLENIAVAMRNDQADELSSSWGNRTDHVLPNMSPEITLGNSFAPFGPFATRSGISFETGFVSEEQVTTFVFDHLQQFSCKGFTLILPHFDIRWLGNWSRYFKLVVVLMEIANQRAVSDFKSSLFLKPTDQFCHRPVSLVGESGFFNKRQDHFLNGLLRHSPRPSQNGAVGQTIDANFVESSYPDFKSSLADTGMRLGEFEAPST